MGSVGQPPAILGEMIAHALVGTFLGILMAYGFVGPLADVLTQKTNEAAKELQCVKVTLLASMQGYAAYIATEGGDGLACGLEFGLGLFQCGGIDVGQNDPEAILRQPLGNAFAQAVA